MAKESRRADERSRAVGPKKVNVSFDWLVSDNRMTRAQKYALTVILVALTTGLHGVLGRYLGINYTFILYYPAVILTALIGGLGPSLLAVALSAFSASYFFLPPGGFSIGNPQDALALGIFCLNTVLITLLAHGMRTASERARSESEEKARLSQQIAEIGTFEWDIQKGVDRWTSRLEAMHGLPPGGFPGTYESWQQLIHPEDRTEVVSRVTRSLRTPQPGEGEWRVVWPDGSVHWLAGRWQVHRDKSGRPVRMTGVSIDITGRKRMEESLRKSESGLRAAQRIARIGSWEWDIIEDAAHWSEETFRMFGLDPRTFEAHRKNLLNCIHPEDRSRVDQAVSGALSGTKEYDLDYRIVLPDKTEKVIHALGEVVRDDIGKPILMRGTVHDVTERRRMENELRRSRDDLELRVRERTVELEEAYGRLLKETKERERLEEHLRQAHKMEAVGTLAGGIAHDFNNMLAVIIGNAELALDDLDNKPGPAQNVEQIIGASRRTRDLIRQILTFSRKTGLEKNPLSLTPLIKETHKLLRRSIPTTIEMSLDIQTDSDIVIGDPSQIQQVLINLATNAGWAMRDKGGELLIGLSNVTLSSDERLPEADMQPGRYLKLTVKDTGEGMTEDVKKRIFEPFFTTKGVGEGTGMGLAVTYGIVRSHGGAISVESKVGEGSRFTVLLPASSQKVEEDKEEAIPALGGEEKILVVDDEPTIVQMLSHMLGRLGYEVTMEVDPTHALTTFLNDPYRFDLVITDQVMSGITGIDLALKMLEVRKGLSIILMTGYSETASPEAAKSAGISEYVMKPLQKQEMAKTVRRVLDRKI